MERLHRLLFELSSAERINIMLELQKAKLKLSHLARKQDLTVTEASRHLQRLNEARLIRKDVDGLYGLTAFGTLGSHLRSGLRGVTPADGRLLVLLLGGEREARDGANRDEENH